MKNRKLTTILILSMLGLTSCLSHRERVNTRSSNAEELADENSTEDSGDDTEALEVESGGDVSDAGDSSGDDDSSVEVPASMDHCSWSEDGNDGFESYSNHLGYYTICQSSEDSNDIYVQLETPITDTELCLFPMTDEVSGADPRHIGTGQCQKIESNTSIYLFPFEVDRAGYEAFSLTGVMAMKDQMHFYPTPFYTYMLSPDAFLTCSVVLDMYYDQSYCAAFDSMGAYIYHNFK